MISVSEAIKDVAIVHNGQKWIVIKQSFSHPSRGASVYSLKMRNLLTNSLLDTSFKAGEVFQEVDINKKKAQYLYFDGTNYVFMDSTDFQQFELNKDNVGDKKYFLIEGKEYLVMYVDDKLVGLILPPKIDLKVTESDSGIKGDTSSNAQKEVGLETGYKLKVPLFIKEGDSIKINTETGLYVEKA